MKKFTNTKWLVFIFIILVKSLFSQTITTSLGGASVCAGNSLTVSYSITGSYNPGNVFTAQLSNSAGSFASPITIGTITSVIAGSISTTIPANSTTSSNYKIRVIGSNPSVIGSEATLTINAKPNLTIDATYSVCSNTLLGYNLTADISSTFVWKAAASVPITGETTSNTTSSTITNTLVNSTTSSHIVTYTITPTSTFGCVGNSQTLAVTVHPRPVLTSPTLKTICSGENVNLALTTNIPSTFIWRATATAGVEGESAMDVTTSTISDLLYSSTPVGDVKLRYKVTPISISGNCVGGIKWDTITVNGTQSTFNQVGPVCYGSTFSMPTTSLEGFTGTWSPAPNNLLTTTYTFTPSAGQCAKIATMTVVVNTYVTPTFNQVSAICSGGSFTLPTTSTNGIVGSWSPAINNTSTTTYTFTPNADQCGFTKTMKVTVNPNTTPTFTQVAAICDGAPLSALPTTSNNGITGTWSPAINNTATTTYTFTPTAGICATTTTMTITVNPIITPTFNQVSAICSGGTFSLPTTSTNGITGTWSPAINNTATTTYTFTPTAGFCATTTTMTVTVNSNVTPSFSQVAAICSGGIFSLPTTSTNGITGTWSPAINNTATTTYTFTPTEGLCATTTTMTVEVNPNVTPTFSQVSAICSGETFSLPTTSTNGITGTWSPAINNTATTTYTFTPTAGLCATTTTMTVTVNSNVTPSFNQVAAICSGGTFSLPTTSTNGITGTWSPAINNTATTTYTFTPTEGLCATTTTMTVEVNPNVTPIFDQVAAICSGGSFELLTTSTNGITGSWSPAIDNTATTTYTFTPTEGLCATTTTMTVEVNPNVIPSFDQVAAICIGGSFELLTTSTNGITGSWSPVIDNTDTTTYTFTPTEGLCATTTTMTVEVNPIVSPTFDQVAAICSGGSFDLLTTSTNGITGTWSPVIDNTNTTTYTFTSDGSIACVSTAEMIVEVNPNITIDTFVTAINHFTWYRNGQLYSESGVYIFQSGCTTYNLNLTIDCFLSIPSIINGTAVGICTSGIVNPSFSISDVTDATSYVWTVPAEVSIISGQGTTNVTLEVTSSFSLGSISVVALNACTTSVARNLTIRSTLATPGSISGSTSGICSTGNNNPSYIVAAVSGVVSYTWTTPTGISITSGQGTNTINLSVSESFSSGSITVTADNACGSSVAKSLTLSSKPQTPGTITGITTGLCPSGVSTPTYSISSVSGATSYTWTVPTGVTITSGQGTTSVTLNVTGSFTSGNITVKAVNDCGNSADRTLAIRSVLATPGSISGITTGLCSTASSPTYSISAISGATSYIWTAPTGTSIASGQGTNSITLTVNSGFTSGSLTVKAVNDCGNSVAKSLSISSSLATPSAISGTASPCGTVTYSCNSVSQATSYTWTVPVGMTIESGQGTNSINVISGNSISGNITVKANNDCVSSSTRTLAVSSCAARETINVISSIENKLDVIVYPNPSRSYVNVEFSTIDNRPKNIAVFDMLGNQITNYKIDAYSDFETISVEDFSTGVYLLKIISLNNEIIFQTKITKE